MNCRWLVAIRRGWNDIWACWACLALVLACIAVFELLPDPDETTVVGSRVFCAEPQTPLNRPVANGRQIIAAGRQLDMPAKGIVVGLTAAQRETGMLNLANAGVPESVALPHDRVIRVGDIRDTLGVFQQGPSWGEVADRMTPKRAAEKFFTALNDLHGWAGMPEEEAAQIVQKAASADAYAASVAQAARFYTENVAAVACEGRTGWVSGYDIGIVGVQP